MTSTCEYVSGSKHGQKIKYYYENNVKSVYNYVNGLRHGRYTIYSKNGIDIETGEYASGMLQGIVLRFDVSDSIAIEEASYYRG